MVIRRITPGRREFLYLAAFTGLVQGGPLLSQLVLARALGPSLFAPIRVAESVLSIAWVLAGAGFASAAVRFAGAVAVDRTAQAVLGFVLKSAIVASIVVAAAIAGAGGFAPLSPQALAASRIACWSLVGMAISRVLVNYFQGRGELHRIVVVGLSTFVVSAMLPIIGGVLSGAEGWAWSRLGGETIGALALLAIARVQFRLGLDQVLRRQTLRYALWLAVSLSFDRVTAMADAIYLDALVRDPELVGQYGAAIAIVSGALVIPGVWAAYQLPRLARVVYEPAAFRAAVIRWSRGYFGVLGTLGVTMWIGAGVIVNLLVGPQYSLAEQLVRVLAIWMFCSGALTFFGTLLLALGRPAWAVSQSAVGLAVSVPLNLVLISQFSVWGAVAAALITVAVRLLLIIPMAYLGARRAALAGVPG